MITRIHDMPVLDARTENIEPSLYNLWRRAHLHQQLPIRIDLPEKKQIAILIENDFWVVVDQYQYDLPLLAWVKFQDNNRSSLHTPVACTMNYYHYMASHLRGKVLKVICHTLERKLEVIHHATR